MESLNTTLQHMGNIQQIKQMSLNDSLDSRWNREERGWEERIWTAPTYVGILRPKLPRGAFISSLFNSPNSVWIFLLFFFPFHLKQRKYHLVYTHLPIKTSWTNAKHRQANCFTNTQHRSTQLHTSHLQSGSLYVNKVPLDILCSPGCFICPFVFPQECCMVSKHTPTHTLCLCVCLLKCPLNLHTSTRHDQTLQELYKNISNRAMWWNSEHRTANLSSVSWSLYMITCSKVSPHPPLPTHLSPLWDTSSEALNELC